MKITLFTSNKNRHNYFINLLSQNCKELFVVQESSTIFQGLIPGHYQVSNTMKDYFDKVNNAQKKIFGNSYIKNSNKNISLLPLSMGDLNQCEHKLLNQFLESDLYIIFGSSYIKGDLVNFLIKKKAINIHMGISPYYRGTDCNFWALYDNNPHLVGATIHLLSKGLDNGPILYHALSNLKNNPFEYTMSTVKSAFHSISERINNGTILNISTSEQEKIQEIRYSKSKDFSEEVIKKFFSKKIDLNSKKFDENLLKQPFFLEK